MEDSLVSSGVQVCGDMLQVWEHTSSMTKPFPLKRGGRTTPSHPAPALPWKIRACILSPKSIHFTQVVSERKASVQGWWTTLLLSRGKALSPVAKGGIIGGD